MARDVGAERVGSAPDGARRGLVSAEVGEPDDGRPASAETCAASPEAREAAGGPAPVAPGEPPVAGAARHGMRQGLVAGTRFMAAIPSAGLLIAAVTLTVRTLVEVVQVTAGVLASGTDMQTMLVRYIECADFFLLSIVMYIMAVGIYALFIDPDVQLPAWLEIRDLDDLKERLVGVIVVVMGVYFLGQLIHGTNTQDMLFMGLGIGAVVLALTYFVRHVISGGRRR